MIRAGGARRAGPTTNVAADTPPGEFDGPPRATRMRVRQGVVYSPFRPIDRDQWRFRAPRRMCDAEEARDVHLPS